MLPSHPHRILAALTSLLALVLVGPATPAVGANATVSVQNFSFTPGTVTVGMGQTVTWVFHSMHTSTSYQRFWDSGHRSSGSYVVTFRDAGTFAYFCTMHPSMTGKARVPPRKVSGTASTGHRLRWSVRTSTPANRRFDVQYRRSGTTKWIWFRTATASRVGLFNPARSGTYVVRARTRNVGVGASGWSPTLSLRIT